MQSLSLSAIRSDVALQPRAALDYSVVEEYANAYNSGVVMPPVVVFRDSDDINWLADGFHRLNAAHSAGIKQIHADVHDGTREDAIWFAASANGKHGLPRRNADKRRAVEMALKHPKSAGLSDRAIAEHCAVSHEFVAIVRNELSTVDSSQQDAPRMGRDGKKRRTGSAARSKAGKASAAKRAKKKLVIVAEQTPIDHSTIPAASDVSVSSSRVEAFVRQFLSLTRSEQVEASRLIVELLSQRVMRVV